MKAKNSLFKLRCIALLVSMLLIHQNCFGALVFRPAAQIIPANAAFSFPSVLVDETGNGAATWRSTDPNVIPQAVYSIDSDEWQLTAGVIPFGPASSVSNLASNFNGDGIYVLWDANDGILKSATYSAGAFSFLSNVTDSADYIDPLNVPEIRVAINNAGNAIVLYEATAQEFPSPAEINIGELVGHFWTGAAWSTPFPASNNNTDVQALQDVVIDSNNIVTALYLDDNNKLQASVFDAAVAVPPVILQQLDVEDCSTGKITLYQDDKANIIYQEVANDDIKSRLKPAGLPGTLEAALTVSTDANAIAALPLIQSINSANNEAVAIWINGSGDLSSTFFNGTAWSGQQLLNIDGFPYGMASDQNGTAIAVFIEASPPPGPLKYSEFSSSTWSSPTLIENSNAVSGAEYFPYYVSMDSNKRTLIVWRDDTTNNINYTIGFDTNDPVNPIEIETLLQDAFKYSPLKLQKGTRIKQAAFK